MQTTIISCLNWYFLEPDGVVSMDCCLLLLQIQLLLATHTIVLYEKVLIIQEIYVPKYLQNQQRPI